MNRHRAQRQKRTLLNLHPIASHIVRSPRHKMTPLARKRLIRSGTVVTGLVAAVGLTTVFAAGQQNPNHSASELPSSKVHADIHALVKSSTDQTATPSTSPGTSTQGTVNPNNTGSSSVVINGEQVQSGNGTVQRTITDNNGTTNVTVTIDNTPDSTSSSSNSSVDVNTYSNSSSDTFTLDNTTRGP